MGKDMIKLVAVDMDGTFLNAKMTYDRKRFFKIFEVMQEKGIHFVVASGNQYFQLKTFFPGLDDDISYVAENGAMVIDHNQLIAVESFNPKDVAEIIDLLDEYKLHHSVQCTPTMAYVHRNDSYLSLHKKFYYKLKEIDSFREVTDPTIKFDINFLPQDNDFYLHLFNEKFKGRITVVSSAPGNVDLMPKTTSKAEGLKRLCLNDGITPDEVMVFGDGGNDSAMLAWAKYSYAMANASQAIKDIAKFVCPSNDEQGVLSILEETFT